MPASFQSERLPSVSCCPGGVGGAGACGHRKGAGGSARREATLATEARLEER